ncbi:MAG: cobyric acid synthase, partial [Acidobacteria bacterium]|nr:cobyric acid synthase [Acidobacteriota bacterium]
MRGALMVCGTGSDVGKSVLVAGLCRLLSRDGVRVAPFKAQNMSLNSAVTPDGCEIGRAQALQAAACGIEPEVGMNPILLKPAGERSSQVVVMGKPTETLDAVAYRDAIPGLWGTVLGCLDDLRSRFDVVLLEGAGGAAEINLLDRDLVNLPLAARAKVPAVLVCDIERGGVFASLYGSVALLPGELRDQ